MGVSVMMATYLVSLGIVDIPKVTQFRDVWKVVTIAEPSHLSRQVVDLGIEPIRPMPTDKFDVLSPGMNEFGVKPKSHNSTLSFSIGPMMLKQKAFNRPHEIWRNPGGSFSTAISLQFDIRFRRRN